MNKVGFSLSLVCIIVLTSSAGATTVPTKWWSNKTDFLNVHDPWDSERVRLGDFTTGFVEGLVVLPEWGTWEITFKAHTDETWSHPEEYIAVFVDGAYVTKVFNTPTPPTTRFEFDYSITGSQFSYRFDFSSPVADTGHHMVMDPGSAELVDGDADGVRNGLDVCPGTAIPEGVPTRRLGRNRWALVDGDGIFDTNTPRGGGPNLGFTIDDTAGCSCDQIIEAQRLGRGHEKFGCSISAMEHWVALVNP